MDKQRNNILIVLLGPTASGKTAIGIELAKFLGTEIISADSRQVYREMNIGTAKPSVEQLLTVKHHLIGHVSVQDTYNAGRFEKEALEIISGIFETKNSVLAVGGTGLYIDALCHGLDDLPESDPQIRKHLQEKHEEHGIRWLQEELEKCDPAYYNTVDIHNPSRLMRALEVFLINGRPYSALRNRQRKERGFKILKLGLLVPREELIHRINQRTDQMMQQGLLDEVQSLISLRQLPALNTVGYAELFDYLDGRCTLEEAVEKIRINTRRYAKRQMTWFRKDEEINWFRSDEAEKIREFLSVYL